jgi:hypothetical protein
MEATIERNGVISRDRERSISGGKLSLHSSLDALITAWARRSAPLSVAVVVSVLDDLLAEGTIAANGDGSQKIGTSEIGIDSKGFARLRGERRPSLAAIAQLFAKTIDGDGGGAPSTSRPLMTKLTSTDPLDKPADAEQLRSWIREALGPPASHDEVSSCFAERPLEAPAIEMLSAIEWTPSDVPALEALSTLPPAAGAPKPPKLPQRKEAEPLQAVPKIEGALESKTVITSAPQAARPVRVESTLPKNPAARPMRPVVRHHWKRSSITVPSAPAARRSARQSHDKRDVLSIPGERSPWVRWTIALIIATGLALIYLELR